MTPLWPFPAFPRTAPAVPVAKPTKMPAKPRARTTEHVRTTKHARNTEHVRNTEPGVF